MRHPDRHGALEDALENLAILRQHLTMGDLDQPIVIDAVSRRLEAAIESLNDAGVGVDLFGSMWPAIRGLRNRLAHGYTDADPEIIRNTIKYDLDEFEATIRRAFEDPD